MTTERELRQRGLDPVVLVDSNGNAASSTAGTIGAVTIDQTTPGANGVSVIGSGSIATGQISVTTAATLIAAARAGRQSITIIQEGTTDVRLGATGVTTGTGAKLKGIDGAAITLQTAAAVYGIVGTGTQAVSYIETF